MNRTEVRLGAGWSKVVRATAWALMGTLLATGCGVRSGGGGGGTGILGQDEHGNIPLEATVIIPDGANVKGQINYQGDVDWFRFRGIAGVTYVLQISGFPPDPKVRPDLDLTGDGLFSLVPKITLPDGATQLGNSAGTQGGSPGDTPAAGVGATQGEGDFVGDSRIMWVCPTIGDYFFKISHVREITGVGAYEIRLATSQFGTIFEDETFVPLCGRFVFIQDDQGVVIHNGFIPGAISFTSFGFNEGLQNVEFTVTAFFNIRIFLPNAEDPEPYVAHVHVGAPNNFVPQNSFNNTEGEPPHPLVFSVEFSEANSRSVNTTEGVFNLPGGKQVRIPITIEETKGAREGDLDRFTAHVTLHLGDAVSTTRGEVETPGADVLRTILGWDWYWDLHPQPNMDLDPEPVATSRPQSDIYQFFETHFEVRSENVVPRDGATQRGAGPPFIVFYDAALKLFQVASQEYNGLNGSFFNPDYTSYVGDRVRVREGGPGENGDVLIDVGTLPPVALPPTAFPPDFQETKFEEPGFRIPIRQLTDSEAEKLRDAFYNDGFYVEVTDRNTGEQLVRAEGLLELSTFPTLEPCSFPPCSGAEPAEPKPQKGVVSFASGLPDGTSVDLYSNGALLGVLDHSVTAANLPGCGLDGDARTLAAELWPGTYYWHAYGKDGTTYTGHVTVPSGGCQLVVIEPDDATN